MKKILIAVAVIGLAGGLALAKKERPLPAPNGIELPADFADWRIISASMRADNDTMRAVLGNKAAVKAAREGRVNPWPDGAALTHLGLPAEFPKFKPAPQASLYEHACGPPDEDCQLDPRVDYEAVEPAPADD